jgi:hypothetical protein
MKWLRDLNMDNEYPPINIDVDVGARDTAGQYHPLLIGNKYAAGNIYSALEERRSYQQQVHQYFQLCRFLYFFHTVTFA